MTDDAGEVRVELAVRTLAPTGCGKTQEETIRRLRALADRGAVGGVTVTVRGERVGLTTADADTDHGREVLATVGRLREWADDHGVSVDRFFETRRVDSTITGWSRSVLELPAMVLAEYRGDELRWVSPCVDGGASRSVTDRLEALESGVADAAGSPTPRIAEPAEE